jgi:hypothetical protein
MDKRSPMIDEILRPTLDTPDKIKTRKECESGHRAGLSTLKQKHEVRT